MWSVSQILGRSYWSAADLTSAYSLGDPVVKPAAGSLG